MSEFVLIMPLIMVILALLWYMGGLMVRSQHMTAMPRYEVWRQVDQGPGPAHDDNIGHPQLNQAFFGGNATAIGHPVGGDYFPEEPYTEFIDDASRTPDAGNWADAFIYRPGGNSEYRLDSGRRHAFTVYHQGGSQLWANASSLVGTSGWRGTRVEPGANPEESTALIRQHVRIGTDWSYTNDWRASEPLWQDTRADTQLGLGHLRSMRDAFFISYDAMLDALDGSGLPEYSDNPGGPENPDRSTLAGMLRTLWLETPDYRGPTVP